MCKIEVGPGTDQRVHPVLVAGWIRQRYIFKVELYVEIGVAGTGKIRLLRVFSAFTSQVLPFHHVARHIALVACGFEIFRDTGPPAFANAEGRNDAFS